MVSNINIGRSWLIDFHSIVDPIELEGHIDREAKVDWVNLIYVQKPHPTIYS